MNGVVSLVILSLSDAPMFATPLSVTTDTNTGASA